MSEIVIRHAETRDYEAIRQIHAQPEVYCNTLQLPHPSEGWWPERLKDRQGFKQLVASIDGIVVGHLFIEAYQGPRVVMLQLLVSVLTPAGTTAASPAP